MNDDARRPVYARRGAGEFVICKSGAYAPEAVDRLVALVGTLTDALEKIAGDQAVVSTPGVLDRSYSGRTAQTYKKIARDALRVLDADTPKEAASHWADSVAWGTNDPTDIKTYYRNELHFLKSMRRRYACAYCGTSPFQCVSCKETDERIAQLEREAGA